MTNTAISRRSDVVSRVEGDETLVLDLQTQTAHCLSGDVALVWAATEKSVSGLATETGLTTAAVQESVEALRELGLVTGHAGLSRRTLLTRGAAVSGAVLAAGAVSIPLPAAALANSSTFTITQTGCSGNSHKVNYTIALTGGKLTTSASYNVSVKYTGDSGLVTDTFTIGTDTNGAINSGAQQTTSAKVSALTSVTVTISRTGPPAETNTFTGSFAGCP